MRAVISFLTKIPTKSADIYDVAKQTYLFPVVGFIIGLMVYLVGYTSFRFLPREVGAIIITLSIYVVTGLIHLDGLADFSDGIMASGDRQKKILVMKDVKIGVGGIFSTVFILLITFYSISLLGMVETSKNIFGYNMPMYEFGCALVISEVSAKLSMNTCLVVGRKMSSGIGSIFILHSTLTKYVIACLISTLIGILLTGFYFVIVYTGVVTALLIVGLAHKNFGGVNGDVIGASNEIARVATLLVWLVVL